MGECALNKNGFILIQALLAMLIVSVCTLLVVVMVQTIDGGRDCWIDEQIDTQWFYSD